MTKAVALLSGGLDSTLAVKLMIAQGIDVYALNFTSSFCTCSAGAKKVPDGTLPEGGCKSAAKQVAEEFGVPLKVMLKGAEYIEIVRKPKHGYGKGINPCLDCRIYMFTLAKKYMEEIGASFIITGEVLGQRPMSQRSDTFPLIDTESGLEGLILRPLSAKHLAPTIPEKEGLVDREKLLDMLGRTRRPQMKLADDLDIGDYPCPSGGCLLTDKIFSKKVRDLFKHKKDVSGKDLQILKVGRHLRVDGVKIIIGRHEADNKRLKSLIQDGHTFLEPVDFSGPSAVVELSTESTEDNNILETAASIMLRYANKAEGPATVLATCDGKSREMTVDTPFDEDLIKEANLC
ncbi:MAG: hypothetical protein KAS88_02605 [Deltaproteobacteria bacterium]|nr:hypothetical protein [Deltaproteobacteria bacterium]